MLRITKDNIIEFADAFNVATQDIMYTNYERLELLCDKNTLKAEFTVYPSNLRSSLGVEAQTIALPEEFEVDNITTLSDIDKVFNGEEKSYITLIWRDGDRETFIEVSPYYVDFGETRISDNNSIFQIQLACNYRLKNV